MTLIEAIKTGKPHKRKHDNFVYIVPMVGGIGYSQADVMAEDWVLASENPVKNLLEFKKPKKKLTTKKK